MIHSFLHDMIHTSVKQKVDGKHIILMFEAMNEQNAFYMKHIPPILRLEPMEHFYPIIFLSEAKVHNYSKQAIMSTSDYIETAHHDVRIFMQQMQSCVFIQQFNGT